MKYGHGDKLKFLGNYASADVQEKKKTNRKKKKKEKTSKSCDYNLKGNKKLIVGLYNTHKNLLLPLILQSIPPT